MALPKEYMQYPVRRYGMDQGRYAWSIAARRKPITLPNNARVALWVTPALQWYPMDLEGKPVAPPGMFNRPYPDYRNYSHRDYGLRVGIFRVMKLLDDLGIRASVPMNSAVAERYPELVEEINKRRWEIIGHGLHMGRMHYQGMDEGLEDKLVSESIATLRRMSDQPVRGWLSIGKSESARTPDLVAAQGVDYLCDWANDDLPYEFRTSTTTLWSMPHSQEIDDRYILFDVKQRESDFVQQIKDQFDTLYRESEQHGSRILSIALHPWVIGHPYRIRYLAEALRYVLKHEGVWAATGAEILDAFKAQ
jgi:allantoinase